MFYSSVAQTFPGNIKRKIVSIQSIVDFTNLTSAKVN